MSLTDIALLCASNTSGQYHQRYTLTPRHNKLAKYDVKKPQIYCFLVSNSRAALKVSTPQLPQTASYDMGSRKLKYAGDILLRFLHTPGGQDSTSSRPRSITYTPTD